MIRFPWNNIPVIKLIIPFISGVVVSINYNYETKIIVAFALISLLLSLSLLFLPVKLRYRLRYVPGICVFLTTFFSASLLTQLNYEINKDYHFVTAMQKHSKFVGKIIELPEEKEKTFKAVVKISAVINDDGIYYKKGKVLLYLRKDSISAGLSYGDAIIFYNKLSEVDPPANPGQFNFKRFLSYKQIYHQAFLGSEDWINLNENHAFKPIKYIIQLREGIIELLDNNIKGSDEKAIAKALLAGYKTDLSDKVRESFASTGAMHVLAVSGLHVGILFLVFSSMLGFLKRSAAGRILFLWLNLILLWVYAIMTGLSPSVLRASAMFSFVLIGQSLKRTTNVYSSIYTSAFCILLFDPFIITQVGFQLSYAAVLGIIAFQPRIYGMINSKRAGWLFDKIWALTAVSFAAQLATFPLAAHYFTQFPMYFLVSNLIVIPAAMLIMYSGFAFLIIQFAGIELISTLSAQLLDLLVTGLNKAVLLIDSFPHGLIEEIYIGAPMTIILYAFIVFSFLLIVKRSKNYLFAFLISALLFLSGILFWQYKYMTSKELIVYSIRGSSLIGFYDRGDIVFYGDEHILNDYENLKYNTYRDIWRHGRKARRVKKIPFNGNFQGNNLLISGSFIQFYDQRFFILQKGITWKYSDSDSGKYIVILKNNPYLNFQDFQGANVSLIFDGSNTFGKKKFWIREAERLSIPYTDIQNTGAFKISL